MVAKAWVGIIQLDEPCKLSSRSFDCIEDLVPGHTRRPIFLVAEGDEKGEHLAMLGHVSKILDFTGV